jgi:hypothetical protein
MELFIKEVVPQKTATGKFYQKVTCGDGETYSAWDSDFTPFVGQAASVEVATKGNFKNIKLAGAPAAPAVAPASKPAAQPHASPVSDFELRKTSVLCALESLEKMGVKLEKKNLIATILWYEHYFTTGKLGAEENNG